MKKRFTEEQIVGFLQEAHAGVSVKELGRKHGFSDASFYGWRTKFRGLKVGIPPLFRTLSIGAKMISEVSDGAKEIHDGV